jgi:hypothetical protein
MAGTTRGQVETIRLGMRCRACGHQWDVTFTASPIRPLAQDLGD